MSRQHVLHSQPPPEAPSSGAQLPRSSDLHWTGVLASWKSQGAQVPHSQGCFCSLGAPQHTGKLRSHGAVPERTLPEPGGSGPPPGHAVTPPGSRPPLARVPQPGGGGQAGRGPPAAAVPAPPPRPHYAPREDGKHRESAGKALGKHLESTGKRQPRPSPTCSRPSAPRAAGASRARPQPREPSEAQAPPIPGKPRPFPPCGQWAASTARRGPPRPRTTPPAAGRSGSAGREWARGPAGCSEGPGGRGRAAMGGDGRRWAAMGGDGRRWAPRSPPPGSAHRPQRQAGAPRHHRHVSALGSGVGTPQLAQ
ncbi:basic salivary proline-rich protein 2-like [Corvus cornix cornix]|uniref:basic salivary proline-rich protein 2-like n=1 Tax=Corvus cornix cornix TaxID=932674 RepID=UPI0019518B8C|nr:basic salivary proline-rich protein 2-like [Corvus cornix cornix]